MKERFSVTPVSGQTVPQQKPGLYSVFSRWKPFAAKAVSIEQEEAINRRKLAAASCWRDNFWLPMLVSIDLSFTSRSIHQSLSFTCPGRISWYVLWSAAGVDQEQCRTTGNNCCVIYTKNQVDFQSIGPHVAYIVSLIFYGTRIINFFLLNYNSAFDISEST